MGLFLNKANKHFTSLMKAINEDFYHKKAYSFFESVKIQNYSRNIE